MRTLSQYTPEKSTIFCAPATLAEDSGHEKLARELAELEGLPYCTLTLSHEIAGIRENVMEQDLFEVDYRKFEKPLIVLDDMFGSWCTRYVRSGPIQRAINTTRDLFEKGVYGILYPNIGFSLERSNVDLTRLLSSLYDALNNVERCTLEEDDTKHLLLYKLL